MRVGIVCPYSFDVPGGVQFHVRDLAEHLIGEGHSVSVLAPADSETALPDYVVSAGQATSVRYNGSVARLNFGPVTAAKVNRWLDHGKFDVLHLHEPITPSISILAMMAAEGPIVATFHTSIIRSRTMQTVYPLVRPGLEKIAGRIAVSEDARRTVTTHVGGDAVVIPNGVYVDRFASAQPNPDWVGTPEHPTIAFLGRMGEPRKGLPVLTAALPDVLRQVPGLRILVAGPGDVAEVRSKMPREIADRCEFLGAVTDVDKAALLASVDVYVAPNTGGESFGIILIEAMSARACVLASDLAAFSRVLDGGASG
ncbi:MAG: glycosyltransferase family 4 protein, partial [Dermatophilaceae bacterium]